MALNFPLFVQPQRLSSCLELPGKSSPRSLTICMASTLPSTSLKNKKDDDDFLPGKFHYKEEEEKAVLDLKIEIIKSMESNNWVEENMLIHLKPVEKCWQPQDYLPNANCEGFLEQVKELRERTREIPDDYFVALVGDMITEEALPTYQTRFNCVGGISDETGASRSSPWAVWSRAWTAEENRHGDLLNKYLFLSGRIDMKQVEKTIQYLLTAGMDIGTGSDPYKWFIYTSFQERATFIAHGNTARLAKHYGDTNLAQVCGIIAADEKRHEAAYTKVAGKLFEMDPNGAVIAFAEMMRKKVVMPAHLMYDGQNENLFMHFSAVCARTGVYSFTHYADVFQHLMRVWNVENLRGLTSDGRRAQDYVCGLGPRMSRITESAEASARKTPTMPFTWIFKPIQP